MGYYYSRRALATIFRVPEYHLKKQVTDQSEADTRLKYRQISNDARLNQTFSQ